MQHLRRICQLTRCVRTAKAESHLRTNTLCGELGEFVEFSVKIIFTRNVLRPITYFSVNM